jgi:hypothetical protein
LFGTNFGGHLEFRWASGTKEWNVVIYGTLPRFIVSDGGHMSLNWRVMKIRRSRKLRRTPSRKRSLTHDGTPFPSTDLSPPEQWDVLASKLQIIAFIGFLEFSSELCGLGEPHCTKGGKVGKYPAFKETIPHDVPFNLFDPFELSKNKSEESKARDLLSKINNG